MSSYTYPVSLVVGFNGTKVKLNCLSVGDIRLSSVVGAVASLWGGDPGTPLTCDINQILFILRYTAAENQGFSR